MGSSIYHVGFGLVGYGTGGEVATLQHAYEHARSLALARMQQEAAMVGAHLVIDVKFHNRGFEWSSDLIEWRAVGTAVRVEGMPPTGARPHAARARRALEDSPRRLLARRDRDRQLVLVRAARRLLRRGRVLVARAPRAHARRARRSPQRDGALPRVRASPRRARRRRRPRESHRPRPRIRIERQARRVSIEPRRHGHCRRAPRGRAGRPPNDLRSSSICAILPRTRFTHG